VSFGALYQGASTLCPQLGWSNVVLKKTLLGKWDKRQKISKTFFNSIQEQAIIDYFLVWHVCCRNRKWQACIGAYN
jgi:hypothetical protein